MTNRYHTRVLGIVVGLTLGNVPTLFASEYQLKDEKSEGITDVGSPANSRAVNNKYSPINIISEDLLSMSPSIDLLQSNVPSFNFRSHHSADALSLTRPFNLRGFSSDNVLILLNGKRRHKSSIIASSGYGINDSAQATDISIIPTSALKQVEVLTEDSAAIYGSDAVAGVLNYVLKDASDGGSLSLRGSEYLEGDGRQAIVEGNVGLPLTEMGFVNLSFEAKQVDATSRTVQRIDAANLSEQGNKYISEPAQIWGKPEVNDSISIFVNSGIELGENKAIYAFGNFSERDTKGSLPFRNPHDFHNIFSIDGGESLLIGDHTEISGEPRTCDAVPIPKMSNGADGNVLSSQPYLAMLEDSNCFSFNSMYPGGYSPVLVVNMTDISYTLGSKGSLDEGFIEHLNGLEYDISAIFGKNKSSFKTSNTINPSLGLDSPTAFNLGAYAQSEYGVNIDINKPFNVGLHTPLLFSMGLEWKEEEFKVVAGEDASWIEGPYKEQGFSVGSDGLKGFSSDISGFNKRQNIATHAAVEVNLSESIMLNTAVRRDDYSTFGDATSYKVSASYTLTDNILFRASYNKGFNAPTIAQESITTSESSSIAEKVIEVKNLPVSNQVSIYNGAEELKPEESLSYGFGLVISNEAMLFSVDFYEIDLNDRIVKTPVNVIEEDDWAALTDLGVDAPEIYEGTTFFANDYDTHTSGLDVLGEYSLNLLDGQLHLSGTYHWNDTIVFNTGNYIDEFTVQRIEESMPKHFSTLSLMQSWESISILLRANYYGEYLAVHNNMETHVQSVGASTTFDTEVSYRLGSHLVFSVGAKNLFDKKAEIVALNNGINSEFGAVYYETSPFDFNGGFYYVKAKYNF